MKSEAKSKQYKMPTSIVVIRVIFTFITVATVVFIFSNSAEIGEISGGKSSLVTAWINKIFRSFDENFIITEHIVRKLGHFFEYAILGFWLMLALRVYTKRVISHIAWPLWIGLLIPVLDEGFQTFVPGRAGMIRDVIIDYSGVCVGLLCASCLILLFGMFIVHSKRKAK
ncbi:MAG: VanZ family protein [Oscillospiraceae bacterium]